MNQGLPMNKQNDFCQACLNGDLPLAEKMLAADRTLANARGEVRPDHRAYMEKQGSAGGWTALHLAAHYGQAGAVKFLLAAGADVNALADNHEANTPLMAAVAANRVDIAELLLAKGADPRTPDRHGKLDAINLAEGQKKTPFVELFRKT
jgi:ankyrin repeat protein